MSHPGISDWNRLIHGERPYAPDEPEVAHLVNVARRMGYDISTYDLEGPKSGPITCVKISRDGVTVAAFETGREHWPEGFKTNHEGISDLTNALTVLTSTRPFVISNAADPTSPLPIEFRYNPGLHNLLRLAAVQGYSVSYSNGPDGGSISFMSDGKVMDSISIEPGEEVDSLKKRQMTEILRFITNPSALIHQEIYRDRYGNIIGACK